LLRVLIAVDASATAEPADQGASDSWR